LACRNTCSATSNNAAESTVHTSRVQVGSPKPFAGFTTSNFAYIGIGSSQELPYPGKLRLKGEAADRAAEAQQAQIAVIQASIADQIKTAYLRLAYLQQTLTLLESSRTTLGQVIESELLQYRTGAGNQADVSKAQLQRTKFVREVTMHHEEVEQMQADLKRLLRRSQESPDIVAQDLTMTTLHYSSLELLNFVRRQNPEVKLYQEAIAELERAVSLSGGSPVYMASLAHAYGVAGGRSQAEKVFDGLRNLSKVRYVSSYDLALASLGVGKTDQALALLAQAVEEHSPQAAFLGVDPRFDGLRSDARFKMLIIRVGLASYTEGNRINTSLVGSNAIGLSLVGLPEVY
jgi:outer membrane protein TolC